MVLFSASLFVDQNLILIVKMFFVNTKLFLFLPSFVMLYTAIAMYGPMSEYN